MSLQCSPTEDTIGGPWASWTYDQEVLRAHDMLGRSQAWAWRRLTSLFGEL